MTFNLSGKLVPGKIENTLATSYRLARRNGELVLQGCFFWREGADGGYDWRDIPIIDLDADQAH